MYGVMCGRKDRTGRYVFSPYDRDYPLVAQRDYAVGYWAEACRTTDGVVALVEVEGDFAAIRLWHGDVPENFPGVARTLEEMARGVAHV